MVSVINSVFDILGWASPVMISAKLLFSEVCKQKLKWDEAVPKEIEQRWNCWIQSLIKNPMLSVPRSVMLVKNSDLELHGFADASKVAVCAAVYVVEYEEKNTISQNLLAAKSRIAPSETSIPRLELIAVHMLAKLQNNIVTALNKKRITSLHYWTDSTTVLHWLANKGTWSVFVRNRVNKIKELTGVNWKYVPTEHNPSDLGTRGVHTSKLGDFWLKGPSWLKSRDDWPEQPEIVEAPEILSEKVTTKIFASKDNDVSHTGIDTVMDYLLQRFKHDTLLRIIGYIMRFVTNCKGGKLQGPLSTAEINRAENAWIKLAQKQGPMEDSLMKQLEGDGIWHINGHIEIYRPILLPKHGKFVERLVEHYHKSTLHGGVQSTMNKLRQRFWIPRMRSLVKKVIHRCNFCKRYRKKQLLPPATSVLPSFRTRLTEPFAATGVDFAGPFLFKTENRETLKAYIIIFTCAATRAVHLKLCKDQTAEEFQHALKEFVARRGTPNLLVSDNAKTFHATSNWLKKIKAEEHLFKYMNAQRIDWRFNLSRAPWWGGFFERLVGVMKTSLSKSIGRALLKYNELKDVLLDVECFMNNRPLCYIGDEYDQPVLTPNILLRGMPAQFLEEDLNQLDDTAIITKRVRYLKTCREQLRKRWLSEYLRALEERHQKVVGSNQILPKIGSVVMLTDSMTIKPKWVLGRIVDIVRGRDNIVRGFKIKNSNGYVCERPLQAIKDLEIHSEESDVIRKQREHKQLRPARDAKVHASNRIAGIAMNDFEDEDQQ